MGLYCSLNTPSRLSKRVWCLNDTTNGKQHSLTLPCKSARGQPPGSLLPTEEANPTYSHQSLPPHPNPPPPLSRLLKLVELLRFPVVPSPPLQETELATLDRLAGVLAHSLELLSDGDEIVAAAFDAALKHGHLPPVQPLRPVDERLVRHATDADTHTNTDTHTRTKYIANDRPRIKSSLSFVRPERLEIQRQQLSTKPGE